MAESEVKEAPPASELGALQELVALQREATRRLKNIGLGITVLIVLILLAAALSFFGALLSFV